MVDAGSGLRCTYDHRRVDTAGHSVPGHGGDNLLVALVLDVPEPDLTPVENLLTPTMLDVLAQAAAAADQPYSWAPITSSTQSTTLARRSTSTPGRR